MAVSAAKLEANRPKASQSTGPKTESGKRRSSLNAVTRGLRTEALVLLDAPNEPTDACENLTNEPNADHENATNEPKLAGDSATFGTVNLVVAITEATATNEPNADHENAPNEPKLTGASAALAMVDAVLTNDTSAAANEPNAGYEKRDERTQTGRCLSRVRSRQGVCSAREASGRERTHRDDTSNGRRACNVKCGPNDGTVANLNIRDDTRDSSRMCVIQSRRNEATVANLNIRDDTRGGRQADDATRRRNEAIVVGRLSEVEDWKGHRSMRILDETNPLRRTACQMPCHANGGGR